MCPERKDYSCSGSFSEGSCRVDTPEVAFPLFPGLWEGPLAPGKPSPGWSQVNCVGELLLNPEWKTRWREALRTSLACIPSEILDLSSRVSFLLGYPCLLAGSHNLFHIAL